VHIHALAAVVAGHHWPEGVELRDLEMLKGLGHLAHDETVMIPVVQNSQDMVELGDAFEAKYLPATDEVAEVPVVIVASHGMYAWGRDLKQARWHAELIEWLLRFRIETREPATPFASAEVLAERGGYTVRSGRQPPHARFWVS
jgi:methylthioribulose-1-phosphate dehydratase